MTWKKFKDLVELEGVKDDCEITAIDVNMGCLDPDEIQISVHDGVIEIAEEE